MPHRPPAGLNTNAFPNTPPRGRHFTAGGRQLLHRSGSGGPAVVFLAGSGAVSLDHLNLHDRVAESSGGGLRRCPASR